MTDTERALFSYVSALPLISSHEFLPLAQRILFLLQEGLACLCCHCST